MQYHSRAISKQRIEKREAIKQMKNRIRVKNQYTDSISADTLNMFFAMLLFKLACDTGYWYLISWDTQIYRAEINWVKYAIGLFFCICLFWGIDHKSRKPSAFFLNLIFLLQIIPITTIYALGDDNTVYYLSLCAGMAVCELVVISRNIFEVRRENSISILFIFFCGCITIGTVLILVYKYRMPSTTAMNIYRVYELRGSGSFSPGKIFSSYFLPWITVVFIPFGIAKSIERKKYFVTILCGLILALLYLYSGNKTYLFAVPLVTICTLWARRGNYYNEVYISTCFGFAMVVVLALLEANGQGLFSRIYSLFGRRCMIVSANNKFKYYDYFSNHPLMGIYGMFPRFLMPIRSYYENIPYTFVISDNYYGMPEMNSNTGFMAEGYMRFGYIGIIGVFVLLAFILKGIDRFEIRTSAQLAIGLFVYPIFGLADAHLIDSMVLGPWMILVIILLVYKEKPAKNDERISYEADLSLLHSNNQNIFQQHL